METFRVAKKSLYDKADKKLQRIASTIGAIIAIMGAATGICSWVSHQFSSAISAQISDFQHEVRENDKINKQAATRTELMILIEHDSNNIVAIERMAKYYFQELNGDLYMTQKVSDWCNAHGRDCSILIGEK